MAKARYVEDYSVNDPSCGHDTEERSPSKEVTECRTENAEHRRVNSGEDEPMPQGQASIP